MTERLDNFIALHQPLIEDRLRKSLPLSAQRGAGRLNDALDYAVFPGGKRLRPVLTLLGAKLVGAAIGPSLDAACAVEFLHSSSLILDDLPGMDDAHLRRNRRSLHLVYDEGIAVLTAVALLNQAYALLASAAQTARKSGVAQALIVEATRCVGADGMIGGQVVDLELRSGETDAETLASRDLKTIALMRLMMTAGALACGADKEDTFALAKFGECFGRAYQVCDDLLDEFGESQTGKPAGQDARHFRPTAVTLLGAQGAYRLADSLVEEGMAALSKRFGERAEVRLLDDAAQLVLHKVKTIDAPRPAYASATSATRSLER